MGLKLKVFWKTELVAEIEADANKVSVVNYTDDVIKMPFGLKEDITIKDLEEFLEERCFPKERLNCKQLLEDLGLDYYEPLNIIKRTHGSLHDDYMWLQFEGENLDYEREIKIRD